MFASILQRKNSIWKTKQNKTKHKTRQNTKQNKTKKQKQTKEPSTFDNTFMYQTK